MEALQTQVETGKWQSFTLRCRWYWHHYPTSFPGNDPHSINFKDIQKIAERRLIRAIRVIQEQILVRERLEKKMGAIDATDCKNEDNMRAYLRHQRKWLDYEDKLVASNGHYNTLWNLYTDVGLLDPAWGSPGRFFEAHKPQTTMTTRPAWLTQ